MKCLMLINLGPRARDRRSLSEDEQKTIAAGYRQINQTPGVTPAGGLEAAIELAARVPAARMGGAIEVRPPVEW